MKDWFAFVRAARRGARRPRSHLLAALALVLAAAAPAHAQRTLAGRVMKDGAPVAGSLVELHRVAQDTSGVLARATSGPDGGFRFALPPVDTSTFTVLFATAMADGVRYFGAALHPNESPDGYVVAVYDTTSAQAAVDSLRVTRRDVIVSPGVRGGWEVAEAVRVDNPLSRTVVGAGGRPVFGMRIPRGAEDFQTERPFTGTPQPGQQDVLLMGDRVVAAVPITPGGRDFLFRYRIPPSREATAIPLSHATDSLTVYVRQPAPDVRVEGLAAGAPFTAEGDTYLRYTGAGLRAGAPVALRWTGAPPVDPRLLAGIVAGLVLAAGAGFALWRRPRRAD